MRICFREKSKSSGTPVLLYNRQVSQYSQEPHPVAARRWIHVAKSVRTAPVRLLKALSTSPNGGA
jgi:hypothetical protein